MPVVRPLTGEPLALDLVNTTWPQDGLWHDLLQDADGHAAWLAEREIASPATPAARRGLVEARDAIRALLEAPGSAAARRRVDRVLGRGRVRVRAGPRREVLEVAPTWLAAWLAARDALRLLDEHDARVRQCANPECVLWFLDTTRSGTRRWCSMAGCGNRQKARRHYRRQRGDGRDSGDTTARDARGRGG